MITNNEHLPIIDSCSGCGACCREMVTPPMYVALLIKRVRNGLGGMSRMAQGVRHSMKERPILFSGAMVRAILAGVKTQTRRVAKRLCGFTIRELHPSGTPGYDWTFRCQRGLWQDFRHEDLLRLCPYGVPGDTLWVRETWGLWDTLPSDGPTCATVFYRATGGDSRELRHQLWRPSIHMPRWASRLTLSITDVRVERLRDISERDAISEGCQCAHVPPSLTNVGAYANLWESINGEGSWSANPWVWVIAFERSES